MYEWIKDLLKEEFVTPFTVENDSDYFTSLEQKYELIMDIIKINAPSDLVSKMGFTQQSILNAIQYYYAGDISDAIQALDNALKPLINSKYITNTVKGNTAFKNFEALNTSGEADSFVGEEVDFYRARKAKIDYNFTSEEMSHIPFNKRGKVTTQRFSIPGLPCFYLGTSSHTCWEELDKPLDNEFNVSHVHLDDSIRLFNLATNIRKISGYSESTPDNIAKYKINLDELIWDYLLMWNVVIACSYTVNEKERSFRSEYIVSQLMMLVLKSHQIDGVVYFGKKATEKYTIWGYLHKNLNVAIMANYDPAICHKEDLERYSDICNKIKISNSVNFAEFKQINEPNTQFTQFQDQYNYVDLGSKTTQYNRTEFYRFECYIKKFIKETHI
ncbi:MAG: hypothetical protein RR710_02740 [Oscillospiraceae bacterium]